MGWNCGEDARGNGEKVPLINLGNKWFLMTRKESQGASLKFRDLVRASNYPFDLNRNNGITFEDIIQVFFVKTEGNHGDLSYGSTFPDQGFNAVKKSNMVTP
jgi:hypothetical protein